MREMSFNPVSFAINLAIGWLLLSFAQAAVRSLFDGKWDGLISRSQAIAFFHDGRATIINIAIIVTIGIVANVLWSQAHHR